MHNKTLVASALAAALSLPTLAGAQTAPAEAPAAPAAAPAAAAPASPHTITANVGLFSSYRFRGIDQTFGKPAIQGGFDYSHASGLYVGNWNSNVSSGAGYPEGNLEMDFYGGWKGAWGDFGADVGLYYYYYPGTDAAPLNNSGTVDNKEIYVGGSWKFLSLKYYYALDDYFSFKTPTGQRTRGTSYVDLSANYDLGGGWGAGAHVGRLSLKNFSDGSYTDWKLGVTKDIGGYVFGLAYVDTDAKGDCGSSPQEFYCFHNSLDAAGNLGSKNKDAGRGIAIVSVSRTF